ncbi:MAG: ABC-F family ATP-binding cassette domain-containing protein [Eubacteriaceae bacterium]|jgi:ATP-binding cassette subfamily F protein uup|nr:transport system ATP-binding/permease protein [Eubacteriaceae bacterium]
MHIAQVENLTKTYGEKTLFSNLNFGIDEKDKIGLIGLNGTGKTSLIKVIAGASPADSGTVTFFGNKRIEYLPQDPAFDESLPILDAVLKMDSPEISLIRDYEETLDLLTESPHDKNLEAKLLTLSQSLDDKSLWDFQAQIKTILSKLGINHLHRKISDCSGGQKKRVALAAALLSDCDLLILDEPTNHLDNETIDWLEKFLMNRQGALLMVTHDRYFLDRIVTKTFELTQGNLYEYSGNYAVFLEQKAVREKMAIASEQKRQNLYRQELAWIRRGARARSTKQKARIQRFEDLQNQEVDLTQQKLDICLATSRLGKKVIELDHVSKSFAETTVLDDFSMIIGQGERIGIIGNNGLGKSSLLNLITGRIKPDQGQIDIGETVRIGYFSQESETMDQNLKAIEYIRELAETVTDTSGQQISAAQMMETFLFDRDKQWVYIKKLSGGEQRRLYLMGILIQKPNVLLFDEPTNDLDLETLAILESYLDEFPGSVITVSHDRYFLDRTCDKIIAFTGNGQTSIQTGNYSDYLAKKSVPDQAAEKAPKKTAGRQPRENNRKGLTYKEKREFEALEKEIPEIEDRLDQIELEMGEDLSDYVKLSNLSTEKDQLENRYLEAIERLEALEALK